MTDPINFRALCVNLLDCLEKADWPPRYRNVFGQWASVARAALAAAQGEAGSECPGCEGSPAGHNNPCGVCGRPAQPAPPAEGEVAELVKALRGELAEPWRGMHGETVLTRAAELLERHVAMENLAADAVSGLRYIEQSAGRLYGVGWDRVFDAAATLQPAHALPLPALDQTVTGEHQ